jgi:hypothetical protein
MNSTAASLDRNNFLHMASEPPECTAPNSRVTVKHRARVCLSDYDNLNVVDLPSVGRSIER